MKLPSLISLEAFVIAAEHASFTRAAAELNLTSAAISQRVSSLEDYLGYQLFERSGPRLSLTEDGKICQSTLIRSLGQLRTSIGSLQDLKQDRALTVKVSPSVAHKWLIPRLGSFHKQNADIDLNIASSTDRLGIADGELCTAIYYGIDPSKGLPGHLAFDHLFKERVFPVCSPAYAKANCPNDTLDLAADHTFLHDDTTKPMKTFPSWRRWCDAFNIRNVDTNHGPRFGLSSVAIQAAIEGHGLALARGALVRHDLKSGLLVRPTSDVYPLQFEYYFVYPKLLARQPKFIGFRDWMQREARRHMTEYKE